MNALLDSERSRRTIPDAGCHAPALPGPHPYTARVFLNRRVPGEPFGDSRGSLPFLKQHPPSNGNQLNGMLSRPRKEECTSVKGPWAKSAFRLLSGLLLLSAVGVSAGHSHVGELTSPTHCALCQVVGMELDSRADVPASPSQREVREDWVLHPPVLHAPPPAVPDLLPRGPPSFA